MSFWTIIVAILSYLLRHYDPAGIHAEETPLEKAAKKMIADGKAAAEKALLDKLTSPAAPASPPAPPPA